MATCFSCAPLPSAVRRCGCCRLLQFLFATHSVSSISGSAKDDEVDLTDPPKRSGSLAEAVAAKSMPLGTHPLYRPIGRRSRVARAAAVFSIISASPPSHGVLDGGAGVSQARPPLPPPWPQAPPWRGLRLPLPPPPLWGNPGTGGCPRATMALDRTPVAPSPAAQIGVRRRWSAARRRPTPFSPWR